MNTRKMAGKCFLTDLDILDPGVSQSRDDTVYKVRINGDECHITICKKCLDKMLNDREFHKIKTALRSLILNRKLGDINKKRFHWNSTSAGVASDKMEDFDIKRELQSLAYPKSPKEKLENFFKSLYGFQSYDGAAITLEGFTKANVFGKWYFENFNEAFLYLKTLEKQGVIEIDPQVSYNTPSFKFTFDGLNQYIQLFEEGYNSKYCFIAMAFEDKTKDIRAAIKKALTDTGFEPYIVDERNIDSERTINDEIIAGLKRCKFCIADFSYHKNGVYFESGFALGQGKQVIYTCNKDEFAKAHFDIKPLQHIIYENPTQLHDMLVNKIEAWVK